MAELEVENTLETPMGSLIKKKATSSTEKKKKKGSGLVEKNFLVWNIIKSSQRYLGLLFISSSIIFWGRKCMEEVGLIWGW